MKRTVIEKNSRESIVISNTEYKGNKYVDIRVFYKNGPDDELKPTRKGVSLRPEQVAALVTALTDQATDEELDGIVVDKKSFPIRMLVWFIVKKKT